MRNKTFYVKACWDDEAGVYYAESDIEGLHLEAPTLEEFQDAVMEMAAELIMSNHISDPDLANKPLRDLVPAIFWREAENDCSSQNKAYAY